MKLETGKLALGSWFEFDDYAVAKAVLTDLRKIADEVEGLKKHRHDINLDDIGLQMTGEPLIPSRLPTNEEVAQRIKEHRDKLEKMAPSCGTCEREYKCDYRVGGIEFSDKCGLYTPQPPAGGAPKEVWVKCKVGDTQSHNTIFLTPLGTNVTVCVFPKDLTTYTDKPGSAWQLANENTELMAKVDELQEAVEEAVEIVEWTLHIFRESGIGMADKCANWLKKHGGKG